MMTVKISPLFQETGDVEARTEAPVILLLDFLLLYSICDILEKSESFLGSTENLFFSVLFLFAYRPAEAAQLFSK